MAMNDRHRYKNIRATIRDSKSENTNDGVEATLVAKMIKAMKDENEDEFFNSDNKDVCYYCGKGGHKLYNCPKKKLDKKKNNYNKKKPGYKPRFKGTCNNCAKQGHTEADCWEFELNKHLRPKFYKPKEKKDDNEETSPRRRTHGERNVLLPMQ